MKLSASEELLDRLICTNKRIKTLQRGRVPSNIKYKVDYF